MTENTETLPDAESPCAEQATVERRREHLDAARVRLGFLQQTGAVLATVYTETGSLTVTMAAAIVAVVVYCSPRIGGR